MTPAQVKLIQDSFAKVVPISEQAAGMFYGRLFEIAPETKPLFKGDMKEQGRKLMATLAVVVNGLADLDAILSAASVLAKRHVAYGVQPGHYAPVGEALLWTLERGLAAGWTRELAAAWAAAYTTLSQFMIGEAYGRRPPNEGGREHDPEKWTPDFATDHAQTRDWHVMTIRRKVITFQVRA
jgi:nitric oxide dioxygenase